MSKASSRTFQVLLILLLLRRLINCSVLRAYGLAYLALTTPKLLALATTVLKKDFDHRQKLRQVRTRLTFTTPLRFLIQLFITACSNPPQQLGAIKIPNCLRHPRGRRHMATATVLSAFFNLQQSDYRKSHSFVTNSGSPSPIFVCLRIGMGGIPLVKQEA